MWSAFVSESIFAESIRGPIVARYIVAGSNVTESIFAESNVARSFVVESTVRVNCCGHPLTEVMDPLFRSLLF